MAVIEEGAARISVGEGVFYNPRMRKLRDVSVLLLKAVKAEGRLLDSTAATGVRGIRYAREAGLKEIVLLDINEKAARCASANLRMNGLKLKCLNSSVQEFCNDADAEQFNIIDLDPFGTPVPYINDLLKVSRDGTLLMVTATDTAVLCGAHQNACLKLYGSKPMHNELCKESGIRILLGFLVRSAAQFNFGTEVMLSVSDQHYMRVFVRLRGGARTALDSIKRCGFAAFCRKCRAFSFAEGSIPFMEAECRVCSSKMEAFGPMYLGGLVDKPIVDEMLRINHAGSVLRESSEARELLLRLSEEINTPFFYSIPRITRTMKISSVSPDGVIAELGRMGLGASRTQFDRDGVKTDADLTTVLGVVRKLGKYGGGAHRAARS